MIKKNCFVKEKGKKESLSTGACSLVAKKQRNKRRGSRKAGQVVRWGCVYAGIFWRT